MKVALAALAGLSLAVGLSACDQQRAERVAASYSSSTKPAERPLPLPTAVAPVVGTDAVPVEEEYEVRAASSITPANLQAKLSELEQELRR